MSENYMQNVIDILPFGVGYFKLLFEGGSEPMDYILLDINPAFERLTCWRREDLMNKRATEFLAGQEDARLYWLTFCTNAMHAKQTREMTQWMPVIKRYLTISVIPIDHIYFAIVLREAECEKTDPFAQELDADHRFGVLDAVFSSNTNAVALLENRDGKYVYVRTNAVHQRNSGLVDAKGKGIDVILGKSASEETLAIYDSCITSGQPASYERVFERADGRQIWQTEVVPIFGKHGIRYLLLIAKDITEHKRVQEENENLSRRLQAIFNQHSAIQLIYDPHSGHIVDASPSACRLYGYTKEELCSMMIGDINVLPPDQLEQNIQSEISERSYYFTAVPYRLKSGETRLFDVYSCPIYSGEKLLIHFITFDVTDREGYRSELIREKDLLKTTLRSIGDGVVTTDCRGLITSLNSAAEELTGWDSETATGRRFSEVFTLRKEGTKQRVEDPVQKVLQTGRIIGLANHTELVNRKGKKISIADSAAPIKSEDGSCVGVVMVFRDVSREKLHNKQIERLSYHDALTGLYNRRYMEKIMAELQSPESLPLCLIMGDVNGLKLTNDVFGHKAGDALLCSVAKLLKKHCKPGGVVARWGGDEFLVLMPRTRLKRAEATLHKIKEAEVPIRDSNLNLSLSLGCACWETMDANFEAIMREAEDSMYHQKLLDGKSYRNAIINTLLVTLYQKSNETEEHSKRIEKHCHAIGNELLLSSKELSELSLLALLHDIGKVSIDPNILTKPGILTDAEWDELRRHPETGFRIAQATPELAAVADLILTHHERWDGRGYPRGLMSMAIPLACRILAVADAFDAMTNERAYRRALSREEAIAELGRNAGTQFDPDIVSLYIKLLQAEKEYRDTP